ncbi:MAG: SRPBCC domain-containing protein [Luteibaculum sp.]
MEVFIEDYIQKPRKLVWEAIVQAHQLSGFFTSSASGDLESGKSILWEWADVNAKHQVWVDEVLGDKIRLRWSPQGNEREVEIGLKAMENESCEITIKEFPFNFTEEDVQQMLGQTRGWTDFLCSLKAYLYCGIKLRNPGTFKTIQ